MIGDNNLGLTHIPDNLECLEVAHKKVIRAIHCLRFRKKIGENNYIYTSASPLFKDKNILKLSDIYYFHLALFAYDCFHGNVPDIFSNYLLTADVFHQHETRSAHVESHENFLYFKFPNLKSTCKSIKIAATCIWNKLPSGVRSINYSKHKFKNAVREWFISQY